MKRFSYTCIFALILFFSFSKSSAQSNIIGNPIKIGNIEVAQYDFRKIPWVDANNSCINLGDGWRLPTIDELKILYQNREIIGNFKWDSYWSSTKGNIVIAWRLNFGDGMVYDRDNTDNTACVRAVKTISNKVENSKETPLKKLENSNSYTNIDSKTYLIDDKNTCKIDGIFITPNGYSYYEGECKNNKANGKGRIYYKGGNYISAVFKDNKIDESYSVEVNTSDVIYVGAMQASELDGPFQILQKESMNIDEVHFDNGSKSKNYKLNSTNCKKLRKIKSKPKKRICIRKKA
jgi:hypothetical protein